MSKGGKSSMFIVHKGKLHSGNPAVKPLQMNSLLRNEAVS